MNYPISDHYNGQVFKNPNGLGVKNFYSLLKWVLTEKRARWPRTASLDEVPTVTGRLPAHKTSITDIGHVTYLIQLHGLNILTDPVFSNRASPFTFAGPKRVRPPAIELKKLPPIDMVLVSHNHYDHMDEMSLRYLFRLHQPQFVTPLGNKTYFDAWGIENVVELDWWDEFRHASGLVIKSTPAQHWSGRWVSDRMKALWSGFSIQSPNQKIFFAGDSGYGDHFSDIFKRLGAHDLALLPIGAYEPRWFMKESHMNPEDAVRAHLDLRSQLSVAMHFGAFQLTNESLTAPVKDLQVALKKLSVTANEFRVLGFGSSLQLSPQGESNASTLRS